MNSQEIQQVYTWIKECLLVLSRPELFPNLTILFENRFTARMGDALVNKRSGLMQVRFSIPLWAVANEEQRKEVVFHEICHIVDNLDPYTDGGHGRCWVNLMRKCGYEGNRLSDVKRPKEMARLSETFKAKCGCRVMDITKNRVTKMKNGNQYKCLNCNQRIVLVQ